MCIRDRLYANGERILKPIHTPFKNIVQDKVGFWVTNNDELLERKIRIIKSMSELNDMGWGIVSLPAEKKSWRRQIVQYDLAKLNHSGEGFIKLFPQGHHIKYDVANKQLQLNGPNAGPNKCGQWKKMEQKFEERAKKQYRSVLEIISNKEKIIDRYKKNIWGDTRQEYVHIKEIPFVISEANEVVCIPQLKDEPRFGVWGSAGNGKSTLIQGIIDRAYHNPYWNVHPAILNDVKPETWEWCTPNRDHSVELAKLNETPKPLPLVYLHPITDDKVEPIHNREGVGFKISFPFEEIIKNPEDYFPDLKGTAKYFDARKKDFLECDNPTPDKIVEVFANKGTKDNPTPSMYRPPKNSIIKVRGLMNQLYSRNILDTWTGIASKWRILKNDLDRFYDPITACMVAGLVPVFVTDNLIQKGYFPAYFRYFAMNLFNQQYEDPYFRENEIKTWFVIDEILAISKRGKHTPASEALEKIQTEGRQRRIGTMVATQNYTKVQDRIRTNCNFIVCFSTPEAKQIVSDYGMDRNNVKRINRLHKFECMAYAKDEYFIVYDMDGNRREDRGPIYGEALFPLSTHSAPV